MEVFMIFLSYDAPTLLSDSTIIEVIKLNEMFCIKRSLGSCLLRVRRKKNALL